ncbi:MAG TPA: valine--tRNA ligase [Thermoplasmata archaeon]|nr:valine--tRNA ligase [Thermoplasmata archaeon]
MSPPELATRFEPKELEARWQSEWARADAFRAPAAPKGTKFSLILPPPNVTGLLTMGHMFGDTVMDVLARCHRMAGAATLWVPGLDHAGLATQVEVRRRLAKQGVRFEELPREAALAEVERWKDEHERRIQEQARAGGFSLDWSRYRYTMDPGSVRATRTAFAALYHDGLIFRGERMVNWDPRLRTAISDLEVVHTEEAATLYHLRYAWADGELGGLDVATVRPETVFGDVAVAVHPEDARFREAIGRYVIVPLAHRRVPVIADPGVDPTFGGGALKITPRHDPLDREIAQRHPDLPEPVEIFDEGARLTGPGVPAAFHGLDRDAARARAVEELEREGLLVRQEPYRHSVGRSERSDAVIEPRLSTQWFVRMAPLAAPVVAAVRAGEIRIHPERWTLTFFRWMEGIQDWCISRQVLWGHRIPVERCRACGQETVTVEPPTQCAHCGAKDLVPDPDVLDTWFTSWLWPFAALGWPERTGELDGYYPTDVLVTGRDIMFFWVARMMMAGFRFTGRKPFSDVVFTGMVLDERGRRMSKHLGNSPDPIDVIHDRGADAMRFGLLFPNPSSEDGPFGRSSLDGARNFLTKLWNLVRFTLPYVPPGTPAVHGPPALGSGAALEDRWILSRYRRAAEEMEAALAAFEPTRAATILHTFVWHDLADRYVEIAKEALLGRRGDPAQRASASTLFYVVERTLRRLHPFVPHVTEELWHALPHDGELLATAAWPPASEAPSDPAAELEMESVLEAIRLLRNLRADEQIPSGATPPAWIRAAGPEIARVLRAQATTIARLARVEPLTFLPLDAPAPPEVGSRVAPLGECYLRRPAAGPEAGEALAREREKLRGLLEKTRGRLADPGFRGHAPAELVRETEEKARDLEERIRRIDEHMKPGASGTPVA